VSTRAERLSSGLAERELDALLITSLIDLRYLSGFTGSHGMAVMFGPRLEAELGGPRFLTDFRYETQSQEEVPGGFEHRIASGDLLDAVVAELAGTSGRLGFDDASMTVKGLRRLEELLPDGWEPVPASGIVAGLRAIKEPEEVERIRASAQLADEALKGLLEGGLRGRTELDVAIDLELRMRRLGASAPSFPSIVAAGPHGALPHAQPRDQPIPADVLVTIDWGALHDGYCSDCTRTYATGEGISDLAREVYELVLSAERAGVKAVAAGLTGREVDAVAREMIESAGHGEHFGHGLGHGVGLEVHEGPRLSRAGGEETLNVGNIVTVEPGVYLPGQLGVRIEDLLAITATGQDVLTSLPRELTVIS
jgi:Xaa-Pro aminopeptidase